ncbi:hypothetical protein SAMN05444166_2481 [Singulisphaera sp. GP187]|uniref:hypothetical protein n=1 Tax=Singulisphaera sp. GP187 TaxID=1882752 RepID=UPI00092B7E37|nr:hypothetical protein [Singulisphaera sp. GP187]SIO10677.1 hypothetical protein SAMN05444166_2481 [Singulisphaera sp. GP187]
MGKVLPGFARSMARLLANSYRPGVDVPRPLFRHHDARGRFPRTIPYRTSALLFVGFSNVDEASDGSEIDREEPQDDSDAIHEA